ncbi:hypothetical protein D3C72_1794300 [compost metagenome]
MKPIRRAEHKSSRRSVGMYLQIPPGLARLPAPRGLRLKAGVGRRKRLTGIKTWIRNVTHVTKTLLETLTLLSPCHRTHRILRNPPQFRTSYVIISFVIFGSLRTIETQRINFWGSAVVERARHGEQDRPATANPGPVMTRREQLPIRRNPGRRGALPLKCAVFLRKQCII